MAGAGPLPGEAAGGGGEQQRFSFHSLCDKQLGVVRAVCPGEVVPEELYCYPKWTERLCSLGVGQGGPSPAPHPGWSLGPGRAPRQTASRPQPPGHRGCGSLQPCGGLVQVALSGPRGSERLLLRPLPTPFPAFCLRPLGGALSGGSDAEVEASGSHVSSVMSGPVSSVGFESSTSPLGTSHTVRTLLPRDLHMRKFQVGQPSLLPWPRALAG